jgi:hypothetical protein
MTTDAGGLRLDGELWERSALGTVGPHSLLGDLAAGLDRSYRPLLAHHRSQAPLRDQLDRAVTAVLTHAELRDVLRRPELAPFCPPGGVWAGDEEAWELDRKVGVVVHDRMGDGVNALLVAAVDRFDPRVAYVSTCWIPNPVTLRTMAADELLGAGWLTLFRWLARRGVLGVTATEADWGRQTVDVLRRIGGFRPIGEVYAALGLSPADDAAVVAEWRATVEGGRVVRFATRPALDGPARDELVRRLAAYLAVVVRDTASGGEAGDRERVSLGGGVGIDGLQGWGNVAPDDWYGSPPDEVAERDGDPWAGPFARGTAVLADWAAAGGPDPEPAG